jgi:predicted membrane channel-forming protein YqfA (hemolysin III family)
MMKYRFFFLGLVFTCVTLLVFFLVGLNGWGGTINHCYGSACFCEEIDPDALILEPVNTWSNVAYMIMGLVILLKVDLSANTPREQSLTPMAYPSFYSVFYGFLVINIGLGSWLFHANMRNYGGVWDVGAMNMYMSFMLIFIQMRNWKKTNAWFGVFYVVLTVLLFLQLIYDYPPDYGTLIFTLLVAFCGSFEIFTVAWIAKRKQFLGLIRDGRWFILGFSLFNFGFIIWNLTNTGRPFCNPQTLWQGHAFWHLFTALATYCFYVYLKSEKHLDLGK